MTCLICDRTDCKHSPAFAVELGLDDQLDQAGQLVGEALEEEPSGDLT